MDPVAVYEAMYLAIENARNGGGPTLVEAKVERFYPHTSDDDHTRYRSAEDIETMTSRDPIEIMEQMLSSRDVLGAARREQIWESAQRIVDEATETAENAPFPQPTGDDDIYKHLYADSDGN